ARQFVQVLAQHRHLAGGRVEQAGDDRDERRLAAAGRPDQQRDAPGHRLQVDAAQRLRARFALAKLLGDAPAADRRPPCGRGARPGREPGEGNRSGRGRRQQSRHESHPRKTMAGSRTRTLRMLTRLASTMINATAAPVPAMTCQIMFNPASCVRWLVIMKYTEVSPATSAKQISPTTSPWSRIIPTIRTLLRPIALSEPKCLRFS